MSENPHKPGECSLLAFAGSGLLWLALLILVLAAAGRGPAWMSRLAQGDPPARSLAPTRSLLADSNRGPISSPQENP